MLNSSAAMRRGSLRMLLVPSIVGPRPALIPIRNLLEEVESHAIGVETVLVGRILVVEQCSVRLEVQAQALQALQKPIILTTLLSEVCLALPAPGKVNLERLRREGLEGTQ